jgi:hypothetical protein
MMRGVFQNGNWLRESEHIVLRLVSLAFSIGSAYAIRWFFEPLDAGDPIHYILWWIVAGGFGLLGFYLSRSLMHRMMSKEPIWAYAPVFLLVEFFEVLCNYAKAVFAVAAGNVPWIAHAPVNQQAMMTILTYVGWSILPLVSPMMAVADMDMTRRRAGEVVQRPQVARSKFTPQGNNAAVKPAGQPTWQPAQTAASQTTVNQANASQASASAPRSRFGYRSATQKDQGAMPGPLPGIAVEPGS